MIEFIQNNYLVILSVVILIVCAIIGLIADGKLFKKDKDKKEDTVTSNPELAVDLIEAAETSADVTEDIMVPLVEQTVAEENTDLPEDIYTPIEEVKALQEDQPQEFTEMAVEAVEPVAFEPIEQIPEEVISTPVVEETNTVESRNDTIVNVLDTPVEEEIITFENPITPEMVETEPEEIEIISFDEPTVEEETVEVEPAEPEIIEVAEVVPEPVEVEAIEPEVVQTIEVAEPIVQQSEEEINFGDINTFDEAESIDDVIVTEPIVEVNEAPIIDEVTVVPQIVEEIDEDEPIVIVEDEANAIVDESAFFNPRSYEDDPSTVEEEVVVEPVVSEEPEVIETLSASEIIPEEPEILDFSIDEIEDVVETAVEPIVEEKVEEPIEVISFSEPIETLDNNTPDEEVTSQEFDTTENVSETSEDDDWKF